MRAKQTEYMLGLLIFVRRCAKCHDDSPNVDYCEEEFHAWACDLLVGEGNVTILILPGICHLQRETATAESLSAHDVVCL